MGTTATWLASLEDPHSGERVGFSSLEAMLEYLENVLCNLEESGDS